MKIKRYFLLFLFLVPVRKQKERNLVLLNQLKRTCHPPAIYPVLFSVGISGNPHMDINGGFQNKGHFPYSRQVDKNRLTWVMGGDFWGLPSFFCPGTMEGDFGQKAVSLGHPFTPHRSFISITTSQRRFGHPGSWGLWKLLKSLLVLSIIPLAWG